MTGEKRKNGNKLFLVETVVSNWNYVAFSYKSSITFYLLTIFLLFHLSAHAYTPPLLAIT